MVEIEQGSKGTLFCARPVLKRFQSSEPIGMTD